MGNPWKIMPGDLLSCGDRAPKRPKIGWVGFVRTSDGRTLCKRHAEAEERAAFAVADRFTAYISLDGKHVTTWTGGELARITSLTESRAARKRYVRVVAPDGTRWHGAGPRERGTYVTLRRSK